MIPWMTLWNLGHRNTLNNSRAFLKLREKKQKKE
jgi:hypothetical protein